MLEIQGFSGGGAASERKIFKNFKKREIYQKILISNQYFRKKKAFSIAEAMITLLIVSMALAAMAPIISKQQKASLAIQDAAIPIGAIMMFDLDSCPVGWRPLTDKYSDAAGSFFRNLGGSASERGSLQNDAVPNITGTFTGRAITDHGYEAAGAFTGEAGTYYVAQTYTGLNAGAAKFTFNAQNSSPVYGRDDSNEVRPKNLAFLYCRKG